VDLLTWGCCLSGGQRAALAGGRGCDLIGLKDWKVKSRAAAGAREGDRGNGMTVR